MTIRCRHCRQILPESHEHGIPCPTCGEVGRAFEFVAQENIELSANAKYKTIREYYEKNPLALFLVIAITIASAFAGLFVAGIAGVALGLVLGGLSFLLGPKAAIKVREITNG